MLLLCACSKDIEIEQIPYTPKIVIDGWIKNDGYASVYITKSSPYLSNYDSASIMDIFINYAKVTVTNSKGESEILTLFREDNFFPPFVYRSTQLKGEVGETYELTVEVEQEVITAETSIVTPPNITLLNMSSISDSTAMINAVIAVPTGETYVYNRIKIVGYENNLHAAYMPLYKFESTTEERFISYKIPRKKEPDPLHLNTIKYPNEVVHEYQTTDEVIVEISTIDEASFNTLNALYIDKLNSNSPFSFASEGTSTNINGGIGHWTGISSFHKVLTIDESVTF